MSYATLVLIDKETSNNLVSFIGNRLENDSAEFTSRCAELIAANKGLELVNAVLAKSKYIMALEAEQGKLISFASYKNVKLLRYDRARPCYGI